MQFLILESGPLSSRPLNVGCGTWLDQTAGRVIIALTHIKHLREMTRMDNENLLPRKA
jgi:hypothetical protein